MFGIELEICQIPKLLLNGDLRYGGIKIDFSLTSEIQCKCATSSITCMLLTAELLRHPPPPSICTVHSSVTLQLICIEAALTEPKINIY